MPQKAGSATLKMTMIWKNEISQIAINHKTFGAPSIIEGAPCSFCNTFSIDKIKNTKEFKEGGALFAYFMHFPSDYQCVRRSATPTSKQIMLLRGRCTRYFLLIINVLYTKRGKSVPPSTKTFTKKYTCNPNIAKSSFAFFRIKRQTRTWWLTTL